MNEPPQTTLPAGTETAIARQQWNQYAAMLREKKRLSKTEWEVFLDLTRKLSESQEAAESDTDWFAEAEKAGAFGKDQVPRCRPSDMIVRTETVAQWLGEFRGQGWMHAEARRRWGVGHHALKRLCGRAEKLIRERQERAADVHRGRVVAAAGSVYRKGMETGNLNAALGGLDRIIDVCGLKVPVVQKMEMSGPGGEPFSVFDCPKKVYPPGAKNGPKTTEAGE